MFVGRPADRTLMGAFAEATPAPPGRLLHSAIHATPDECPGQVVAQTCGCAR